MKEPRTHRQTEKNALRTQKVIARYHGLLDLLSAWESTDIMTQANNHAYILGLRAKVRATKNLILHRAGPDAEL